MVGRILKIFLLFWKIFEKIKKFHTFFIFGLKKCEMKYFREINNKCIMHFRNKLIITMRTESASKILHLFILIITGIFLIQICSPCGIITHIQIANRAKYFFSSNISESNINYSRIIEDYSSYFEAGAPFPDWGYPFGYSDEAEFAHWPPFISSFVEYTKRTYEKTDTKRYEQLLAFIFGVSSHSIADVLWHWGKEIPGSYYEQGFIPSVKHYSDFCHDSNAQCHNLADTGGDLYLQYRGHLTRYTSFWHIPVDDIVNVYKENGYDVNKYALRGVMILIYLASYLEKEFGWFVWEKYERNSSFIAENLDTYYHGGLDDMAIHTAYEWLNVINLISKNGTNNNINVFSEEITRLFAQKKQNNKDEYYKFKDTQKIAMDEIDYRINLLKEQLPKDSVKYSFNETSGDLEIEINNNLLKNLKFAFEDNTLNPTPITKKDKSNLRSNKYPTKSYKIIKNDVPYSYFGHGITAFNISINGSVTRTQIAFSSHGNPPLQTGGILFYDLVGIENGTNEEIIASQPNIKGYDFYSKFGYKLTTVDINHDGIEDVVVSAPSEGKYEQKNPKRSDLDTFYMKEYTGKVYVFLGKENQEINNDISPDYEIRTNQNSDIFMNLGTVLEGIDCNNDGYKDLLIGSPYASSDGDKRGNVAIITDILNIPIISINENGTKIIYLENADFFLKGTNNFEEMGTSVTCSNNMVIIGKPGYRAEKKDTNNNVSYSSFNTSSGSISAYQLSQTKGAIIEPVFSVICNLPDTRYGSSLALNYPYLAVGAPLYSINKGFYQGRVFVFDISNLKGDIMFDQINQIILEGGDNRMRFGQKVQFFEGALYVSAPFYSGFIAHERGRIYKFSRILKSPQDAPIVADKADLIFDSPIHQPARFGDNFLVWKDYKSQDTYIAVSAPFNLDNLNSGYVIVGKI